MSDDHHADPRFVLIIGLIFAAFFGTVCMQALRSGRMNASRSGISYMYRSKQPIRFWLIFFLTFLMAALGVLGAYVAIAEILQPPHRVRAVSDAGRWPPPV